MKLRTLFGLIALAACGAATAATAPSAVKASYDVYKDGLHIASVDESYEKTGDQYRIVSDSNPAGLLACSCVPKLKCRAAAA